MRGEDIEYEVKSECVSASARVRISFRVSVSVRVRVRVRVSVSVSVRVRVRVDLVNRINRVAHRHSLFDHLLPLEHLMG